MKQVIPEIETGIISFEVANGTLKGTWTSKIYHGEAGRQEAKRISGGPLEGEYETEIFLPQGDSFFKGKLTIKKNKEVYDLNWDGDVLIGSKRKAQFKGVGLKSGANSLSATWVENAS